MTDDELLHKWIHGELTEREEQQFRQRPEYPSLVQLYRHTDHLQAPQLETERVLANVLAEPKTVVRRFPAWISYAVAASVVLLVALAFLLLGRTEVVELEMARGERQNGTLPDQSTFVLNAESSLRYDPNTWDEDRRLALTGEAYFSVEKGSQFTVQTPQGTVQVLGTRFNVKARGGDLEVSCLEGRVEVRSANGSVQEVLGAQEALRIESGNLTEQWKTKAQDAAPWVSGETHYYNIPLAMLIQDLERQFDIEIDLNGLDGSRKSSGYFPHQSLEIALRTSLGPQSIQFRMEGSKVVLFQE